MQGRGVGRGTEETKQNPIGGRAPEDTTTGEVTMARAADAAAYILEKKGAMDAWKLQKLVYYSQAWHLVWEDRALFEERIEAWANGPVAPALFKLHKGEFTVDRLEAGDSTALDEGERESIEVVLQDYGDRTGQWLSELTHLEPPWREARRRAGARAGQRCDEEIRKDEMAEYYGGLLAMPA